MMTNSAIIKTVQVLSPLFLGIVLYINYQSVNLPINGVSTKEISDMYSNLFTPAPITFSVWGIIYLGLVVYVIWQLRSVFSNVAVPEVDVVVQKIGVLFLMSCIFNGAWIFAWHSDKLLFSVILMLGLLLTLIEINKMISYRLPNTPQYKAVLKIPFGLYLGWISIATIANIAAYLTKINWNGFGLDARFWQMLMVLVGSLIACWAVAKLNNVAYGIVVIWGLGGILMVRMNDAVPSLAINLLIILCGLLVLFTTVRRIRFDTV